MRSNLALKDEGEMLVETKTNFFKKFGTVTLLLSIGVIVGAVGVLFLIVRNQVPQKSEEQVRREYVTEYTASEELRLGIRCHMFMSIHRDFLLHEIRPVLVARQSGLGWNSLVGEKLRQGMERQRDYFFGCGKLHAAGRNGEWNGLTGLRPLMKLDREFITLHTLISFGEPRRQCESICLDRNFRDLQEAYEKLFASIDK